MPNGVQPVTVGDSDSLRIGQTALAIGSPLGLQQTLTQGIVSAVRLPDQDPSSGAVDLPAGAVQTDASINPGNSGGPLFDAAGNVIGVNTAILSQSGGSQGIGFAIPINVIKRVVPDLIHYGMYRHPQIGIAGTALAAIGRQSRQQLGIPSDVEEGVLVLQVSGGAQQAGIQPGRLPPGTQRPEDGRARDPWGAPATALINQIALRARGALHSPLDPALSRFGYSLVLGRYCGASTFGAGNTAAAPRLAKMRSIIARSSPGLTTARD